MLFIDLVCNYKNSRPYIHEPSEYAETLYFSIIKYSVGFKYATAVETRHEKTGYFAYAKTKSQISFTVTAKLISAFVFATCTDSTISLLLKSEISSF